MKASQLRASILQQAVEGKLVPQKAEEGTAAELLADIRAEREALIKTGKIKKAKPLPEITEDEIPFEIPKSWEWVRLGEIGEYKKGPFGSALTKNLFVPKSIDTIKVYEQKNAIKKDASLGEYYITKEYFESKMRGFEVFSGDILVSCAGTIGETFILPDKIEQGIINQALMRITLSPFLDKDYFIVYFESILKGISQNEGKGSALKNIPPFSIFKNLLFALPPLTEQKRIVAKLEELMPLIDAYEKEEVKLSALEKSLPEKLRRSVLQQAVEGKLVPQKAEEGTAAELLKEIEKERAELVKAGKMKKTKPLPEIAEEEIPFKIPESWEWVRFGKYCEIARGGSPRPINAYLTNDADGLNWIKISDAEIGGKYIFKTKEKINKSGLNKTRYVTEGDFLLTNSMSFGRPYILKTSGCIHDGWLVIHLDKRILDEDFLYYLLSSRFMYTQFKDLTLGSVVKNLKTESVMASYIPLPPLAEQKRIVAKVEELMQIIDKL